MEGVLATSSGVKYHWFGGSGLGVCGAVTAGDGPFSGARGRGGEVLDECVGGEGTGGGTSRWRPGDRDWLFWGTAGGW